jgi:hypothetical protein
MPLVTALNLRRQDRLADIDAALREALVSIPDLKINAHEVVLAPVLAPDGFHEPVARINVDVWERADLTKDALQELAGRMARAFRLVTGPERKVTVVIRPYDPGAAGWVSL